MSESPFRIFVVDDDPVGSLLVEDELEGRHYDVTVFASGEACLEALGDPFSALPDLILLDIEMPGLDGYEVCRRIRGGHAAAPQIVFVSARDDLDSRLAGYDAGGDDFIVKPFAPREILHKVRVAERVAAERRGLSEQISHVRQAAFSAMSSMGEMGTVIQFMRESLGCRSREALAATVFRALADYGLKGVVQFIDHDGETCLAPSGPCSELEISILHYISKLDRITQIGDRLVVNYPHSTLLVLDLPEDGEKVGRLRDHLAIIAEGVEAALAALAGDRERAAKTRGIVQAVGSLSSTLAEIGLHHAANRRAALDVATRYGETLLDAFLGMGLSEHQEKLLMDLATDAINEITALTDSSRLVEEKLGEVKASLQKLLA